MTTVAAAAHAEHRATRPATQARDSWPVRALGLASEAADQPPLIALSVATIVLGAALRRPAIARGGARMLASHLLATGIKTVIKNRVDRTRPAKAEKTGHHVAKGHGAEDTNLNSFPSGHTAGAVAVAQAAARDMPAAAMPARAAALLAAGVQMPRGKHYLSDVLAGAAIGWASEAAVSLAGRVVARAWRRSRDGAHGSISDPVLPVPSAAGAARPAAR